MEKSDRRLDFKLLDERDNKLIGMKEVRILIYHDIVGTPKREEVRELVASLYKAPLERVYVWSIRTLYGASRSIAEVAVYESEERAKLIEPNYIIERHSPKKGEG